MRNIKARLLVAIALLTCAIPAVAQNNFVTPGGSTAAGAINMCLNGSNQAVPCSSGTPLQIAGTFSATLGGFAPGGTFASLTATNASASVALPAGAVVLFQNTGTTTVSCTLGIGSATATANEIQVAASSTVSVTVGTNTFGACIDQIGSVSNVVVLAGGSGLFTGFGGGGAGGGGGGAITIASGAVASGAYASGSIASGALASGSMVDLVATQTPIAAAAATATKGIAIGGQFDTTQKTLTNGQQGSIALSPRAAAFVAVGADGFAVTNAGTFATQSTLAAETTKVIGTTRTLGNAGAIFDAATGAAVPANGLYVGMSQGGNLTGLTGTSGNLNVQCANCSGSGVSTADEATMTPGTSLFAGSGGFFQTTATSNALTTGQQGMFQVTANRALFSNLRNAAGTEVGTAGAPLQVSLANTASNGTAVAVSLAAETTKVIGTARLQGNVGGVLDAIGQNVAAPANWLQAGCQFQTTPTTITATNGSPCQMDSAGNILVNVKTATGLAQGSTTSGQTGSMIMGAVTTAPPTYTTAQTAYASLTTSGAVRQDITSVNSVAILTGTGATGTGAQRVTVSTDQATNAGAALVKGGVGVVNGGSTYQAVAASQTATVLQSATGATGDYLSHCDIYPTSTSPGVVTVFDNTNTAANSAILFAGGATSTSNLVPIAVPVGAVSVNGAWKVTTGANVSVVCYGKFS